MQSFENRKIKNFHFQYFSIYNIYRVTDVVKSSPAYISEDDVISFKYCFLVFSIDVIIISLT